MKFLNEIHGSPAHLCSGRTFASLLIDELACHVLTAIQKRALQRPDGMPPMCVFGNDLISHRLNATGFFEASQLEAIDTIVAHRLAQLDRSREALDLFLDVGEILWECGYKRFAVFTRRLTPRSLFLGSELVMNKFDFADVPEAALVCAY